MNSIYLSGALTSQVQVNCLANCLVGFVQVSQLSETLSTCRFAQRMMQVTVDAQKNKGGMSSVHGNLFKLDPVMQQYLEVGRLQTRHAIANLWHLRFCAHSRRHKQSCFTSSPVPAAACLLCSIHLPS